MMAPRNVNSWPAADDSTLLKAVQEYLELPERIAKAHRQRLRRFSGDSGLCAKRAPGFSFLPFWGSPRRLRKKRVFLSDTCDKDSSDRCRGDVFPFGGSGCRRTSVRPPAAADP